MNTELAALLSQLSNTSLLRLVHGSRQNVIKELALSKDPEETRRKAQKLLDKQLKQQRKTDG